MGSKGCGGIDFTPCNHHPETCTCRWKDEPIKINKNINKFKEALKIVTQAQIYIQRIDYLLSGDDGDESFLKRLKEELNEKN